MRRLIALVLLVALAAILPVTAHAATDDLLISDHEFTQADAMSLADVHAFLQQRNSPLAELFLPDSDGALKYPTEILWLAANEARISPKVLLTTLQKEQRLVTDPKPSARQIDFAMGYGCPDGSGCSERFRGFGKQIRGAALQFRGYLDDLATKGETIAAWAVGRMKQTGDGFTITPKNAATAALYSYTPWRGGGNGSRIGGNMSFARIWKEWFGGGAWPDGTILEAPDGARWLLQNSKRRRLATPAVAAIRSASAAVVAARPEEIETYMEGPAITFVDYTVVAAPDGTRWLLVGDQRRMVSSQEVFRKIGFNPEEVEAITAEELTAYAAGATITAAAQDPRGTLVQERETKKRYLVVGSVKQPILDPIIERLIIGETPTVIRTAKELKKLKTGEPLHLPDGLIVTAPKFLPQVFIISRGQRRPFASPRALEALGYQWSDVRHVANAALELHPLGMLVDDGATAELASKPTTTTTPAPTPAPRPRYISGLSIF